MRLVVTRGDYVRVSGRLPAVLLGDDARDVSEDYQLAEVPRHTRRRPPLARGGGHGQAVRLPLFSPSYLNFVPTHTPRTD